MRDSSVHFDRAAGYYDETRGYPDGVPARVAERLCVGGGLDQRSRVLEVGVGTGRIALPLARCVESVTGLDLSTNMLAALRARRTDEPVRLVRGSALAQPFASGVFDAVVAVHVFHLMPAWRDGLAEIARVLSPRGRLLVGQDDYPLAPLWDDIYAKVPRPPNAGVADPRTDFAHAAGFVPIGAPDVLSFRHDVSLDAFLDGIERRVWSALWRLDPATHRALADAAREAVLARYGRIDATATLDRTFTLRVYAPPSGRD